jgi:Zn-dependent protease with chaperone function
LQVLVATAGIGLVLLAGAVLVGGVSWQRSGGAGLLRACRIFTLPSLSVAGVLTLLLGIFVFATLGRGMRSATRQLRATRRFTRALGPAGVELPGGERVFVSGAPEAFCVGLLHPRVYVSEGLLATLDDEELAAVLAHEAHHARRRDPLRLFLGRTLAAGLFFLPVLGRLGEQHARLVELDADRAAVRSSAGNPGPLASALLRFDEHPSPVVVGIAAERVDHLLGVRVRWKLPLTLLAWALVTVVALAIVALRARQASAHSMVDLPMIASQLCMVAMAAVPLIAGAGALLSSRRLLTRH